MGNNQNGQRVKVGKTLTDENVAELAALSSFAPEQVREWHTGFLVSRLYMRLTVLMIHLWNIVTNNLMLVRLL